MQVPSTTAIPVAPEQCVCGFGTTLIVAPHADDESLGCGGLIALLRNYDQPVFILLLSDGTLSHPNSKQYPAERLRELRETELTNAATILGVDAENLICCRYQDRSIPGASDAGFDSAVGKLHQLLQRIRPQSIFVPWRRDPHPDHRAAFQLLTAANEQQAKVYEYPIWLQELGQPADLPTPEEVIPFRLDISRVQSQKQAAIAAHQSQTTRLIQDDPEGFILSEEMLRQFDVPYETFYQSK